MLFRLILVESASWRTQYIWTAAELFCYASRIDLRVREETDAIAEPPRAAVADEGGGQP